MDGNGRWASKRFLTRSAGHKAGGDNLRKLAERMNAEGFKYLTVYAFSTENWNRPAEEVRGLMSLMSDYIDRYIKDSKKNNMRICVIGDIGKLDQVLRDKIEHLTELTKNHQGMRITFAINYGSRDELVRAARKIAAAAGSGRLKPAEIDEKRFSSYLDTYDMPDPDIVIRTSGESRLSNFLLWQLSYSEFFISPKLWPDFGFDDLMEAVRSFNNRDRRFGRVDGSKA